MAEIPIGLRSLLADLLLKKQEGPDEFWFGLTNSNNVFNIVDAQEGEPKTPGYTRVRAQLSAFDKQIEGGVVLISVESVTFGNLGDERWPEVSSVFLSTAEFGGELVAVGSLSNGPRILAPGDVMRTPMTIRW